MANIIVKKFEKLDKDPFHQSDRDPIGRCAGKGDRNRSISSTFDRNFPKSVGPKAKKGRPRRTTIRYGANGKKEVTRTF